MQTLEKAHDASFVGVADGKGEHRPEQSLRKQSTRDRVIAAVSEARVVDALDAPISGQRLGHRRGVATLTRHSQRQGAHAAQGQIRLHNPEHRARIFAPVSQTGGLFFGTAGDDPTRHVAMPAKVLRRAVNDRGRALAQRFDQVRRGKGRIDQDGDAVGLAEREDGLEVGDALEWVRDHLQQQGCRPLVGHAPSQSRHVEHVDEANRHALLGQRVVQQGERAAVAVLGRKEH